MAGVLEALIVRKSQSVASRLSSVGGLLVPLDAAQLSLVPVTDDLRSRAAGAADVPVGFHELRPNVAALGEALSDAGRCGYLHLEFHGGSGFHSAIGWEDGRVAWGPNFTANDDSEPPYRSLTRRSERGDWAINGLLRWLGVTAHGDSDEFRVAGLEAYRRTEEWAASAPA